MIYRVPRTGRPYQEVGADSFDRRGAARLERHHVRRLGAAVARAPGQAA